MQSDVELVRGIIDALNRGDVDGMLARMDPDFEWRPLESSPVAQVYRGHDHVRGYIEDWLGTFDRLRIDLENPEDVAGRVVAPVHAHGRGGERPRARHPLLPGLDPPVRDCGPHGRVRDPRAGTDSARSRAEGRVTHLTVPGARARDAGAMEIIIASVLMLIGVVYGYYTVDGSGIAEHPYHDVYDGAPVPTPRRAPRAATGPR